MNFAAWTLIRYDIDFIRLLNWLESNQIKSKYPNTCSTVQWLILQYTIQCNTAQYVPFLSYLASVENQSTVFGIFCTVLHLLYSCWIRVSRHYGLFTQDINNKPKPLHIHIRIHMMKQYISHILSIYLCYRRYIRIIYNISNNNWSSANITVYCRNTTLFSFILQLRINYSTTKINNTENMAQFSLRIKSVQSHPLSLPLLLSLLFLFSLFPLLPSFISMLLPSISHLIWNAIITLFPDNWIAYRCFSFFTFSPPNFLVFSNTTHPHNVLCNIKRTTEKVTWQIDLK